MNKRSVFLLLILAAFLLGGCQLAKPESGDAAQPDRLAGVFITTGSLDTVDLDAYLQENMGAIAGGQTMELPAQQGRIYAEQVVETHTDDDGNLHTDRSYAFQGLDGVLLAHFRMEDGSHPYWATAVGEGICDIHSSHVGDDNSLEGTLYVSALVPEVIFYFHPVYQTVSGEVYLVHGDGLHVSTALGGGASHSLTDTTTITENGEEMVTTTTINVSIEFQALPEKLVLLQMDENDQVIGRSTYTPGQLPEELASDADTAYIIAEEHGRDGIVRRLYQPSDRSISVFYSLDGTLCVKDYMDLLWPDGQK